jgi:hypothetical protein
MSLDMSPETAESGGHTPGPTDEVVDWTAAWIAALDRLELDVDETERMMTGLPVSVAESQEHRWTAPTGLGPLPASLNERAMQVNARQIEVARRIALALGATRREADLAHRLSQNSGDAPPLYVDHLM